MLASGECSWVASVAFRNIGSGVVSDYRVFGSCHATIGSYTSVTLFAVWVPVKAFLRCFSKNPDAKSKPSVESNALLSLSLRYRCFGLNLFVCIYSVVESNKFLTNLLFLLKIAMDRLYLLKTEEFAPIISLLYKHDTFELKFARNCDLALDVGRVD